MVDAFKAKCTTECEKMLMKWQQQQKFAEWLANGMVDCDWVVWVFTGVCFPSLPRIRDDVVYQPLCCVCHLLSRLFHRFNVHSATINKEWAQKCNEFQIFFDGNGWTLYDSNEERKKSRALTKITQTFYGISFDSFMTFLTVIVRSARTNGNERMSE